MTTERNAQGVDGLAEVMGLLGKATPGPWEVELRGGHELTGVDAEIAAADDCEAYALRTISIVAPSKPTSGKRRNPETGAFDIPIPSTICEDTFDPRSKWTNVPELEANIEGIAAAVNYLRSHGEAIQELVEAVRCVYGDAPPECTAPCPSCDIRAALAKFPEPRP